MCAILFLANLLLYTSFIQSVFVNLYWRICSCYIAVLVLFFTRVKVHFKVMLFYCVFIISFVYCFLFAKSDIRGWGVESEIARQGKGIFVFSKRETGGSRVYPDWVTWTQKMAQTISSEEHRPCWKVFCCQKSIWNQGGRGFSLDFSILVEFSFSFQVQVFCYMKNHFFLFW